MEDHSLTPSLSLSQPSRGHLCWGDGCCCCWWCWLYSFCADDGNRSDTIIDEDSAPTTAQTNWTPTQRSNTEDGFARCGVCRLQSETTTFARNRFSRRIQFMGQMHLRDWFAVQEDDDTDHHLKWMHLCYYYHPPTVCMWHTLGTTS